MNNICPICNYNNDSIKPISVVKNIWKESKNVYICEGCKLYYIDMPTEKELIHFYESNYYSSKKNTITNFIDKKIKNARALSRFQYIKKYMTPNNNYSIAEIGAADGLLLNYFKKNKNNVFGYELNSKDRNTAKSKYNIDMQNDFYSKKNNSKYDVVILSHVLEHFLDPTKKIKNIYNALNEDGIIFIEIPCTPNHNEVSKEDMNLFFQTEHTLHFNVDNLALLLVESGFTIIDIKYNNYNINKKAKKSIWLGSIQSKLDIVYILNFFIRLLTNPKNSFINYKHPNTKDVFGKNIRLIAKK